MGVKDNFLGSQTTNGFPGGFRRWEIDPGAPASDPVQGKQTAEIAAGARGWSVASDPDVWSKLGDRSEWGGVESGPGVQDLRGSNAKLKIGDAFHFNTMLIQYSTQFRLKFATTHCFKVWI
jgi:hypothetical protein